MQNNQIQLLEQYMKTIEKNVEQFKDIKGMTIGELIDNYDSAMKVKKEVETMREEGEICGEEADKIASTIQNYLELYRGLHQYVQEAEYMNPNARVGRSLEEMKDPQAKHVYSTNISRIENVVNHRPYNYNEKEKTGKAHSTTSKKNETASTKENKLETTKKVETTPVRKPKTISEKPLLGKNSYLEGIDIIQEKLKLDLRKGFTYGFYKKLENNHYMNRLNELEEAFVQQYGSKALTHLKTDPEVAARMIDVRTTLATLTTDFNAFMATPVPRIGTKDQKVEGVIKASDLLIRSEEEFYSMVDAIPMASSKMERSIKKLYRSGITAVSGKIDKNQTGLEKIALKNQPEKVEKKEEEPAKIETTKEEEKVEKTKTSERKEKMQAIKLQMSEKFDTLLKKLKVKNFSAPWMSLSKPLRFQADYHYNTCKKFLKKNNENLSYQDILSIAKRLEKSEKDVQKMPEKGRKKSELESLYTSSVKTMSSRAKTIQEGNGLSEKEMLYEMSLSAEGFVDFYNESHRDILLGVTRGLATVGLFAIIGLTGFLGMKFANKNQDDKTLVANRVVKTETVVESKEPESTESVEESKEVEIVSIDDNYDKDQLEKDLAAWKQENRISESSEAKEITVEETKKEETKEETKKEESKKEETTVEETKKEETSSMVEENTQANGTEDNEETVSVNHTVSNLMVFEQEFTVKEGTRGYSNMYNLKREEKSLKPKYAEDHVKNAYKVIFLVDDRPVDVILSDTEKCNKYLSEGAEVLGYLAVNEFSYENGKINPYKTECFYSVDDIQTQKTYVR